MYHEILCGTNLSDRTNLAKSYKKGDLIGERRRKGIVDGWVHQ